MMSEKGSVLLTIIFMILVGLLGLSMLNFTIIHSRIIKARNIHRSESGLLYNHLIFHLHNDSEKIMRTRFKGKFNEGDDYFDLRNFPGGKVDRVEIKKEFIFSSRVFPLYKLIKGIFRIDAESENNRHKWHSESIFKILSGNIPLNFIPLFINNKNHVPEDIYFKEKKIQTDQKYSLLKTEHDVKFDISSHLISILGIEQDELNIAAIKRLLGINDNIAELEEGVSILISKEKAGPVFVQGDVDRIVLSLKNGLQYIEIYQNNNRYDIRYTPGESNFIFENTGRNFLLVFDEKIIINGDLLSLESEGDAAFHKDSHLEFIILGNLTINSSLIRDDPGSGSTPPVTIISASSPFNGKDTPPVTVINSSGPCLIHGSLNIGGEFINNSSELTINGNLYCRDVKNRGIIKILKGSGDAISEDNFFVIDFAILKDFRINLVEEITKDE